MTFNVASADAFRTRTDYERGDASTVPRRTPDPSTQDDPLLKEIDRILKHFPAQLPMGNASSMQSGSGNGDDARAWAAPAASPARSLRAVAIAPESG
jgi:hypothetical protein